MDADRSEFRGFESHVKLCTPLPSCQLGPTQDFPGQLLGDRNPLLRRRGIGRRLHNRFRGAEEPLITGQISGIQYRAAATLALPAT